jgi:hypothetical protein
MTAQASAVAVAQNTAAVTGACTLRGYSISSTAGADVVVYDNTAASGMILAQFTLAAKGTQAISIADGVRCLTGIYVSSSAAVQGSVWVG